MMDEFDEWDYYEKLADRCADIHLQKEEDWFRYIEDDFENFVWGFPDIEECRVIDKSRLSKVLIEDLCKEFSALAKKMLYGDNACF